MSYSRWSNSAWYSFYNANNKLSLWYSLNDVTDIEYKDCKELTPQLIQKRYNCTLEEAHEAMVYVNQYMKDYEKENGNV